MTRPDGHPGGRPEPGARPPALAATRWDDVFRSDLEADDAFERRLLFKEVGILFALGALALLLRMLR